VIAKVSGSGERVSTYEVDDTQMAVGSTIGAPKGVIVLKANGGIDRFFCIDSGQTVIGGMQIYYWDPVTNVTLGKLPGQYVIHPERQEHVYELSNGVKVREKVFMLNGQPELHRADPAIAYYNVQLENASPLPVDMASIAAADVRGSLGNDVRARFDVRRHAFLVTNASDSACARSFSCSVRPSHWEVTQDHGKCSRVDFPGPLSETIDRGGDEHIALLEHRFRLKPGQRFSMTYTLVAASNGTPELRRVLDRAPSVHEAEKRTRERYHAILSRAVVMTPDADVNRGVLWAKANMLRTQLLAPTGWCFVNDPTRSNNSVARDTAWFAFGSDYVTPDFSRESLLWYLEHMERKGMAVEYYDIRNGKTADYRLNINDDTPLIILAAWHHYNATGNRAFLKRAYRPCRRAADYILSQRNKQGLVFCTVSAAGEWGIAGWRNAIDGYRISGAVTEINSECYAALDAVGKMAAELGKSEEEVRYSKAARELRAAINKHLVNRDTDLYYLTIDVDGSKRTDITCDLVFPVMFGVADRDRAAHIVSRLSVEPFWSEAGIRTVPRDDITYAPVGGYGLRGGVWVGVTFWYALAAARFNSDFMASSLSDSFKHYSRDPRGNNTVPGQFSEWLHGETLVNQGMMLSPWFPPRYVWAAIEGAAGLDLSTDQPSCNPRLAPDWRWLGVRNLRFRGGYVTWFIARTPGEVMYATFRFRSELEYHAYDRDVTDELLGQTSDDVTAILLQRDGELVLFVGNTADRTVSTSIKLTKDLDATFDVKLFSSLRGEWIDSTRTSAELYRGFAVQIDRRGFSVVTLRRQAR